MQMKEVIVVATDRGLLRKFDKGEPVFTNEIEYAWQFPSRNDNAHLAQAHVEAKMRFKAVLLPIHVGS